jgi:IPT/TIG domain-containing protein/List-Bact-rpt repeat protein
MKSTGSGLITCLAQSAVAAIICMVLGGVSASSSFAAPFPIATGGAAMGFAFDGTHYLVGIENHLTATPTIGAQMLNADGTKFGSYISTGRTGIATAVAFDGTNYLLIWEDNIASNSLLIYGLFVSKTGVAVGSPFAISGTDINFDGIKTMAFGGGKYLVTYTRLIGGDSNNRYIAGRIVNPDGSMGDEFRISTGNGTASDVAFDGINFFVVWREDSAGTEIRGRIVSPAGVPGTEISVNASAASSENPKSVTFDGTNYLVVWNDEIGGFGTRVWDVFGQLVSPSGALVGGVITISNAAGHQLAMSVAFDGANYLAVWVDFVKPADWDVYGQYISMNGALAGSKIPIATEASNQMGFVGFANGKYLVLVGSGVIRGSGGLSQIDATYGMFLQPPAPPAGITGILPSAGLIGTTVTISGNSFDQGATVSFNGVSAVVTVNTGSQLTVTVPAGATTGPVFVTTLGITIAGPIFTPRYTLSEVITGNGQINGTPLSCLSSTCSSIYDYNSPVVLSASESYGSIFSVWSGACTGTDKNSCGFSLTGDKNVTATFTKLNNVRVETPGVSDDEDFDTLKNAYTENETITAGSVLKLVRSSLFDFSETLTIGKSYQVILKGGFDDDFEQNAGFYSTIKGPLIVKSDKLNVENIIVKQ